MTELKVKVMEFDQASNANMEGIKLLDLYRKKYNHQGSANTNSRAAAAAAPAVTDDGGTRQQQVRDQEVLQLLSRYLAADIAAAAAIPITAPKDQQQQHSGIGPPDPALPLWHMRRLHSATGEHGTEYILSTCHFGESSSSDSNSSSSNGSSRLTVLVHSNAGTSQADAHDGADKLQDMLREAANDSRSPEQLRDATVTDNQPLMGHNGCKRDTAPNTDRSAELIQEHDGSKEASNSLRSDANDRARQETPAEANGDDDQLSAAGRESTAKGADDEAPDGKQMEMQTEERWQHVDEGEKEVGKEQAGQEADADERDKRRELQPLQQDDGACRRKAESASDGDDADEDDDGDSQSDGAAAKGQAAGLWREDSVSSADSHDACDECGLMTLSFAPGGQPFCRRCSARQRERREVVQEIIDTEVAYIDDLGIVCDEFAAPLEQAALIGREQAAVLFGRIAPLAAAAGALLGELRSAAAQAADRGDAHYGSARIGRAFLDRAPAVLLEFEAYCVAQEQARSLLDALRRERPLIDVFLEQSQLENARLRRMPLKSFLARPVQRTTQYPLLLRRLYKVTPQDSADRADVRRAAELIAAALSRINPGAAGPAAAAAATAAVPGLIGAPAAAAAPPQRTAPDAVDMVRLALHTTGWPSDQLHVVVAGKVGYAQPADHDWWHRGAKRLSLQPAYAALVTRGRDRASPSAATAAATATTEAASRCRRTLCFPRPAAGHHVVDAAFVFASWRRRSQQLVPLLGGRPLRLGACVLARDAEYYDLLELSERQTGECIVFRPAQGDHADLWYSSARRYCVDLGHHQHRRHAVPNLIARR